MKGLVCRECGKEYPAVSLHVCELCFGPLEVQYNYKEIQATLTRKKIESGPKSLWRYVDLLPIEGEPTIGLHAGFTPLVRAKGMMKSQTVSGIGAVPKRALPQGV